MKQAIVNGRIIGPATAGRGNVEWDGGVLTALGEGDYKGDAGLVTDAGGDWVSPGFIDIHTHGAGGHDFMDCTVEAYLGAAEMSARHGATTIFPTTLASTNENLCETCEVFRRAQPLNTKGADMPGLHLEGPYFAYNQRGAQDPRYLRDPRPEEIELCTPYLREQTRTIDPEFIVTLGNFSTKFILKTEVGITRLHGKLQQAGRFKVFPIFHPAAALYDGSKRVALEDDFATLGELLRQSAQAAGSADAAQPAPGAHAAQDGSAPESAASAGQATAQVAPQAAEHADQQPSQPHYEQEHLL